MWFTPNTCRDCFVVFLFSPSRLRSKQSTWQRRQKKLLRADVLLFIAIFMYVGMTENFANKMRMSIYPAFTVLGISLWSTKPKQVDSADQKSGLNSQILGFWTATWVAPKPYQWELFSRQTCSEFRTSSTGTSWVPTQDSKGLKSGIKCGEPLKNFPVSQVVCGCCKEYPVSNIVNFKHRQICSSNQGWTNPPHSTNGCGSEFAHPPTKHQGGIANKSNPGMITMASHDHPLFVIIHHLTIILCENSHKFLVNPRNSPYPGLSV